MDGGHEKIIMVDDDVTILNIGKNALIDRYDLFTVPSGEKLFKILERVTPDLILLDVEMPEMNGYEVIKVLKSREDTAHIPVIFLTAINDTNSELEGLSLGAIDYITKPFSPQLLLKRIEVHLLVQSQKNELKNYNDNLEQMVMEKTKTVFELQNAVLKTVAELVECRDDVTGGHIERTTDYLRILVNALLECGAYKEIVSTWDIDFLILSAQLHDVGKIAIKDSILLKPAKLTLEEFEEMKKHTVFGIKVIKKIEESTSQSAFLKQAEILAGSHHEKWDGTGYPEGISGEDIPLQGRLMAIVDVYDALTNDRPYKKAIPHEEAVRIIKENRGKHFDPLLIDIFLKHEKAFKNVDSISGNLNTASENKAAAYKLRVIFSKTVAEIVNYRNGETSDHMRIQGYLKIMLKAMQKDDRYAKELSTWDMDSLIWSAQLHDVGKIAIKDKILQKPEKLTSEEFDEMKAHADFGVRVIQKIEDSAAKGTFMKHIEALAGSHHEKWNGMGYPLGLSGEDIPLQGRLMAIVDVYDALTGERPYKKAVSHEQAVETIRNESGTHFDPWLVKIFLEHESEFKKVNTLAEQ